MYEGIRVRMFVSVYDTYARTSLMPLVGCANIGFTGIPVCRCVCVIWRANTYTHIYRINTILSASYQEYSTYTYLGVSSLSLAVAHTNTPVYSAVGRLQRKLILQQSATDCNRLQHTTTRCNTCTYLAAGSMSKEAHS